MKRIRIRSLLPVVFLLGCVTPEEHSSKRVLPILGPPDIIYTKNQDGTVSTDTLEYVVPEFRFVNQDSTLISSAEFDGHIYVADFFFTHCPTICPVMTSQLARLQSKLEKDGLLGDVKILSHTVDPDRDDTRRLKEYADQIGANTEHWFFVTGRKADIYDQAQQGYLVTAFESDTAAGGFFHTDQFVLLDRQRRIRGFYDGTSTAEVDSLFNDILELIKE